MNPGWPTISVEEYFDRLPAGFMSRYVDDPAPASARPWCALAAKFA